MWRLRWALAVTALVLAATAADETLDPEGLKESDTQMESELSVHVGQWTECAPTRPDRAATSISVGPGYAEQLHAPRLGLQRRHVQCRRHGGGFVEPMRCGAALRAAGAARVCVLRAHCALADWLPWTPRPDGALARSRRVRALPQGGGQDCGVVQEVRPAAAAAAAGARWEPGPWGACQVAEERVAPMTPPTYDSDDELYRDEDEPMDVQRARSRCGGGLQRRELACAGAAGALPHAHCAHAPVPKLVQPCEVPCPRDCEVGPWSEWGPCQPAEGCPLYPVQQLTTIGYSVRRRRVLGGASRDGAPCPPLEERRACPAPRCGAWRALPWGACELSLPRAQCGRGRRTRELMCVGHDGKEAARAWCSAAAAPARSERCRIACAGDCVVAGWGPWGACSAPCAAPALPPPTRERARRVLAHAAPGGWPCPPAELLTQQEPCNTHACATYSWLAAPWGDCRRRDDAAADNVTAIRDEDVAAEGDEEEPCVEEGEMTREVMCVQNNVDVVRDALCVPLHRPEARRACTVRCHRLCRIEAWKPWSTCPDTCDPSTQTRVRDVRGGAGCGARAESRPCPTPRSCRAPPAAWLAGAWGACTLAPGQGCGAGYRVRTIWCGSESGRVDASACAGQLAPAAAAPCAVPCDGQAPLSCRDVCADPLKYLDSADPEVPDCSCKNVTLQVLPADSDCILPPGAECGDGQTLRTARCQVGGVDVPLDVCKKYHPLTSGDAEGLVYTSRALLSGACSVPCARDCVAAAWGAWGPCAAEPGSLNAFRFRTREVIEEGTGGGRECGATLQRSSCALPAPRWLAGEWAPCTHEHHLCGRAVINRTVTCISAAGAPTDPAECARAEPPPPRETACRAPCPNDCVVSTWSDWSPCEQTKWGGRRDRTRVVLRPAAAAGAPCPPLVQAEPCAALAYSWHVAPWDDCQPLGGSPCGEGVKKRSVRCLRSDGVFVNDSYCPKSTETTSEWCYVPCGVDCALGPWGAWDTSACGCGATGHMRRTRQQLVSAEWPGRPCGAKEQRAPCPREPCMRLVSRPLLGCHVQTSSGLEQPSACGWGVRVSLARCEILTDTPGPEITLAPWRCTPAIPGRIVMPPAEYQEQPCEVECGCADGAREHAGPWGAWSACRGGARSRTRQLLVPPRPACSTSTRLVTIEWSNCTEDGDSQELFLIETRDEKPQRAGDHEVYHDGYIEGSVSLLAIVWVATLVLISYGAYLFYKGIISCFENKKLKNISKV